MSTKPAIGLQYMIDNKDKIYSEDGFLFHVDYKTMNCKPFKLFDKYYDLENPTHMKFIKDNRKKFIREYDYLMHYEEAVNIREWLNNNERMLKNNLKGGRIYYESNT